MTGDTRLRDRITQWRAEVRVSDGRGGWRTGPRWRPRFTAWADFGLLGESEVARAIRNLDGGLRRSEESWEAIYALEKRVMVVESMKRIEKR